jgi:hypothetical protein
VLELVVVVEVLEEVVVVEVLVEVVEEVLELVVVPPGAYGVREITAIAPSSGPPPLHPVVVAAAGEIGPLWAIPIWSVLEVVILTSDVSLLFTDIDGSDEV